MDLTKLSKQELLTKCKEHGITKCKSKTKSELINLINSKFVINNSNSNSNIELINNVELIIKDHADKVVNTNNNYDNLDVNECENKIISLLNINKILKVGTLFSGIGAFEHALNRLNINHKIIFACDIDKYVKQSYFENYLIDYLGF